MTAAAAPLTMEQLRGTWSVEGECINDGGILKARTIRFTADGYSYNGTRWFALTDTSCVGTAGYETHGDARAAYTLGSISSGNTEGTELNLPGAPLYTLVKLTAEGRLQVGDNTGALNGSTTEKRPTTFATTKYVRD